MEDQQVLEFRLPDLGEGLADAELVSWAVAVGDRVELNQTIAEVETAKAQVALPCPYAGTVLELLAEPGDTVPVGAPLIRIAGVDATPERQSVLVGYGPDSEPQSRRARAAAAKAAAAESASNGNAAPAATPTAHPPSGSATETVAGSTAASSGTDEASPDGAAAAAYDLGSRPSSRATTTRGTDATGTDSGAVAEPGAPGGGPHPAPAGGAGDAIGSSGMRGLGDARDGTEGLGRERAGAAGRPAAIPAARKLARELGIDLAAVTGTGPDGAIVVADVQRVRDAATSPPDTAAASGSAPERAEGREGMARRGDDGGQLPIHIAPPVPSMRPDTGMTRPVPAGRETRTPVSGIRKRTAAAMVASARDIPQASTFVTTDFTGSMELLDHLRGTPSFAGLSLTPLALVAKATLVALSEFPELNAVWDEANQEIVTKHYVNLGIAVATERGLLVPNLAEAQALSLRDLCGEIGRLAEAARSGTATLHELTGGTFTITNVGVFGVDTGVPLVNPGEAAILCLGSIRKRPWVHRDEIAVRWVTTLGLSFDHRLVDGEQAARFLASVAALVEDPLTLLGRV
ncbi:dihydrolipoamide acetyltransferase family protein [Nocardia otitidiscaviarum]|uniref:dihydrolipoamide acetyltransferase family protein n=1 Tax=Nocardia otitidiscaviarum TaxID=1823 RepID=UPI0018939C6C|nr:dihydrolipoamide acetyltransferase family protein [Nocardia otitidiscaviarum]MBF6179867.1 2-oxo acid dehydrogenase subunit E2 [Nocardia otitidiscaviarum]